MSWKIKLNRKTPRKVATALPTSGNMCVFLLAVMKDAQQKLARWEKGYQINYRSAAKLGAPKTFILVNYMKGKHTTTPT